MYRCTSTISHLCKMIAATIQGRLLLEGDIYCNVIIIATATIQKQGSFTVQIILLGTFIDKLPHDRVPHSLMLQLSE